MGKKAWKKKMMKLKDGFKCEVEVMQSPPSKFYRQIISPGNASNVHKPGQRRAGASRCWWFSDDGKEAIASKRVDIRQDLPAPE